MQVRDRVALVTGGAAGSGRAIARRLAAEGGLVVVADVDPDGGRETARLIEMQGGRAWFVHADMASDEHVRRWVNIASTARLGRSQRQWSTSSATRAIPAGSW